MTSHKIPRLALCFLVLALLVIRSSAQQQLPPLSPEDLLRTKRVSSVAVTSSGDLVAYSVDSQRSSTDESGTAYSELHVFNVRTKESRAFVTGKVRVGSPLWTPDGSTVGFLMKRGDKAQVWSIPIAGGEARQLTNSDEPVLSFRWHPDGRRIAYIAQQPKSKREKALDGKGYAFVFYEENLKDRNLYVADVSVDSFAAPKQLTHGLSVWSFEFSPDGQTIAMAASDRPLVDQSYMAQKIYILDIQSGKHHLLVTPPGKLGNYAFDPQGKFLALTGARDRHDNAVSQVYTIPVAGGTLFNATPDNYPGHVTWVGWKNEETILFRSADGIHSSLRSALIGSRENKILLTSQEAGVVFEAPAFSSNGEVAAFIGQSPKIPGDFYLYTGAKAAYRATNLNPWLSQRALGEQTSVKYSARDGREIEGILIHPVGEDPSKRYPLITVVHGGPESHYSNGWLSSYSEPGQVFAGKGYLVFYPNYRASTGYGVSFAAEGFGDPAGKEFDDIADGIDYLTAKGLADRERIGLGGGSYGGYASAWFATYYTKYVRAVVMFVGISDLVSKQSTTDIPEEELAVHAGKPIEQTWEFSLKRSPVYWAHQSSTATLICGGADDPRVHPSQGLELYRRMKINNHPAVRLVQYPGEQHGNARQPARIDLLYRTIEWYDWYVRDAKPLNGPMPRLDISDRYGLELP
jgi:dipeptidyl aminopeptidase/acylaminoacyl peptidase